MPGTRVHEGAAGFSLFISFFLHKTRQAEERCRERGEKGAGSESTKNLVTALGKHQFKFVRKPQGFFRASPAGAKVMTLKQEHVYP